MPRIIGVACLLVLANACAKLCNCPVPPPVQTDSVMVVGSDSVMHVGSDSVMVVGSDSVMHVGSDRTTISRCGATLSLASASPSDTTWFIVTCGRRTR